MPRAAAALAALAATLAWGLVGAPGAAGSPEDDFRAVHADWQPDGRITACRFTEAELRNAGEVAESDPDLIYTSFPAEVDREIARWRAGNCSGSAAASPLREMDMTRARGVGPASREYVVLKNRSNASVSLNGATIRNRRGRRVRVPRGVRVRPGRSVRVTIGCARGKRRAGRRGSRAWACSRRALFSDRGDVARLVDRRGAVVTHRNTPRRRR